MVMENVMLISVSVITALIMMTLLYSEWARLSGEDKKVYSWMKLYFVIILISSILLIAFKELFYAECDIYSITRDIIMTSVLWVAAATDKKYAKIPNSFVIAGAFGWILVTIIELINGTDAWFSNLVSGIVALAVISVSMGICLVVMKNSIGMGDIKLLMVMAVLLGITNALTAIFVSLLVSFAAALYLLISKKKDRKDTLEFAPFMLTGTLLSIILMGV